MCVCVCVCVREREREREREMCECGENHYSNHVHQISKTVVRAFPSG